MKSSVCGRMSRGAGKTLRMAEIFVKSAIKSGEISGGIRNKKLLHFAV